jgi:hypothetical protein
MFDRRMKFLKLKANLPVICFEEASRIWKTCSKLLITQPEIRFTYKKSEVSR